MARDYSSRHDRDNRDKNGRPKPAKRAASGATRATPARVKKTAPARPKKQAADQSTTAGRNGTPRWVWIGCGVFAAIVIVSGWYIFARPAGMPGDTEQVDVSIPAEDDDARSDDKTVDPSRNASAADTHDAEPTTKQKPRFSFYKMLPNYHVEVGDEGSGGTAAAHSEHAPHEAAEPDNGTQPTIAAGDQESAPPSPATDDSGNRSNTRYVIQAGAFSSPDDADRRKAQLALLGVTAEVVNVDTASGRTVYRVQSDAVNSPGKAQSLAQRLKSHGIETMVRQAD